MGWFIANLIMVYLWLALWGAGYIRTRPMLALVGISGIGAGTNVLLGI